MFFDVVSWFTQTLFECGRPLPLWCAQTSRLLAEEIGWGGDRVRLAFQSRFGREEWLKPYIQEVITELPSQGIKKIAIISPGFISDCVETLEEVAIGLKESFVEAAGKNLLCALLKLLGRQH